MLKINFHSICHVITMVEMSINKSYYNIKNTRKDEQIMNNKELFIQCARQAGISIEDHSIVKVTDFRKVANFLSLLRNAKVLLGMDMSSLTCSGDVEIVPDSYEPYHIMLIEKDNRCVDCFKFKSLLLLITDLEDPQSSPEMFFESDIDTEWLQRVPEEIRLLDLATENNGRYAGLMIPSLSDHVIYDKEKVDYYLELDHRYCEGLEVEVPEMTRYIRNTQREMLVYVNVQECLGRHHGSSIIYKCSRWTSDDLVKLFSKDYKLIQD